MKHCPSDETLAAYVDHRLSPEERRDVESHLSRCDGCVEGVAILHRLVESQEEVERTTVPARVIERAEALIAERARRGSSLIEVVVRAGRGLLELVRTTGDLVTADMAPVPVRGASKPSGRVLVREVRGKIEVVVEIEGGSRGPVLRLLLSGPGKGERPDGLRVDLRGPSGAEVRYVENGLADFGPHAPGDYRIRVESLGDIRVQILA